MEQPKIIHMHRETTIHNGASFKTAATIGFGLYLGYSYGKYVISLIDLVAERIAKKAVDKIYKKDPDPISATKKMLGMEDTEGFRVGKKDISYKKGESS